MRHVLLMVSVVIMMLACTNTTERNSNSELNQEFKKYHIQQTDIEKGVVRVTEVTGHELESMKYSLFKMTSENQFVRENYNSDFDLVSKTYHQEKLNSSEELKTIVYQNNEPFVVDIIKPEYMTYSSEDTLFLSEYKLGYMDVKIKCRYVGKSSIDFKGETIDCIIYERHLFKNFSSPGKEFTETIVSQAYYGENLGVVYAKAVSTNDTIIQRVVDIISIDEFEKLKSN